MSRVHLNGKPVTPSKPRPESKPQPKSRPWHDGKTRFILGVVVASTALNGWAGYQHGGTFGAVFMGLIPWGVLQGAANAVTDWNRIQRGPQGRNKTAPPPVFHQVPFWTMLLITLSILSALFISLWHCSETIQAKTGAATWQAWFLAITLDVGLVAHEISKAAK